jgi:hypothetical protein
MARKLLNISSEGGNTMTGHQSGVVTQLEREAKHKILRTWCITHQMDLVVKAETEKADSGLWIKKCYELTVYFRMQQNLVTAMGVKCPKKLIFGCILARFWIFFKSTVPN